MSTWNESDMIQFGKRLAAARKKIGVNQTEFANWLGIGRPTLSRYERGEAVPPTDILAAIASRLAPFDMSVHWLLYGGAGEEGAKPATRIRSFGSLVGLRFTGGGIGEVLLGAPEIRRLLKVCIDQEKDQSHPNQEVLNSLDVVIEHFYEQHFDFEILADVPIAVHGVKLVPAIPMASSEDDLANWSASRGLESPQREMKEKEEPGRVSSQTTQTFHGNVGQVGGGDIHNYGDKDK